MAADAICARWTRAASSSAVKPPSSLSKSWIAPSSLPSRAGQRCGEPALEAAGRRHDGGERRQVERAPCPRSSPSPALANDAVDRGQVQPLHAGRPLRSASGRKLLLRAAAGLQPPLLPRSTRLRRAPVPVRQPAAAPLRASRRRRGRARRRPGRPIVDATSRSDAVRAAPPPGLPRIHAGPSRTTTGSRERSRPRRGSRRAASVRARDPGQRRQQGLLVGDGQVQHAELSAHRVAAELVSGSKRVLVPVAQVLAES